MRFVALMTFACALMSGTALAQNAPTAPNAAAATSAASTAPDAAAGKQKNAMCIGCHGIPGWRTAYPEVYHVPLIHGQHQAYIVKALQAYRSGERSHPSMRAIAAGLSDQDMMNLAAYYGAAPVASAAVAPAGATVPAVSGAPATPTK